MTDQTSTYQTLLEIPQPQAARTEISKLPEEQISSLLNGTSTNGLQRVTQRVISLAQNVLGNNKPSDQLAEKRLIHQLSILWGNEYQNDKLPFHRETIRNIIKSSCQSHNAAEMIGEISMSEILMTLASDTANRERRKSDILAELVIHALHHINLPYSYKPPKETTAIAMSQQPEQRQNIRRTLEDKDTTNREMIVDNAVTNTTQYILTNGGHLPYNLQQQHIQKALSQDNRTANSFRQLNHALGRSAKLATTFYYFLTNAIQENSNIESIS